MPHGITFRPKELPKASARARSVLECLQCGNVIKKSTTTKPNNRGFVGCRNNKLLSSRIVTDSSRTAEQRVRIMASYYSRLAEHFSLAGPKLDKELYNGRAEISGLKSLLYQSLNTTIQGHFKISKTKMVSKYGSQPGGYPVPNEERPRVFQLTSDERRFRPWSCVRSGGCPCWKKNEKDDDVTTTTTHALPPDLERYILSIVVADGNNRTFRTLESRLRENHNFEGEILPLLKTLHEEGKIHFSLLEERPRRPNVAVSGAGRRRLLQLQRDHGKGEKKVKKS